MASGRNDKEKWFDFGDGVNVSLRQSRGQFFVDVAFAHQPGAAILERAYDDGWMPKKREADTEPFVYQSWQRVTGLADVGARLETFFDADQVKAALKEAPRPPVDITPSERPAPEVTKEVLGYFPEGAPSPLMEHIARSIAQCHAIMGARGTAAKQLPYAGDAFGVFDRLVSRTDPVRAAEVWGTTLYGLSRSLPGAGGSASVWNAAIDELMEADAAGRDPDIAVNDRVKAYVASVLKEIDAIQTTGLASVDVAAALRGRLVQGVGEGVGYRIYDGAHFKPAGAPELVGNTFSAHQSVSGELATDAKARLTLALSAAARGFGVARDRLFGEQSVKFFFARDVGRAAGEGVRGLASAYQAGEDVKLFSVHIVPTRPGALIHEIGHQVHNAGDRKVVLEAVAQHEFSRLTRRLVSELEARGLVSAKDAEYLVSPPEVFARAFEAHVIANQPAAQTGGSLSSIGVPSLTPTGAELTAFMSDMRAVVLESRDTLDQSTKRGPDRDWQQHPAPSMGL